MKNKRVGICEPFMALTCQHSIAMLDLIVTMNESSVSIHTLQTKQYSKQWVGKGTPGPIKAKVHVSRMKQMVWPSLTVRVSSTPTTCPGGPW
jgi:hypothetical protein